MELRHPGDKPVPSFPASQISKVLLRKILHRTCSTAQKTYGRPTAGTRRITSNSSKLCHSAKCKARSIVLSIGDLPVTIYTFCVGINDGRIVMNTLQCRDILTLANAAVNNTCHSKRIWRGKTLTLSISGRKKLAATKQGGMSCQPS